MKVLGYNSYCKKQLKFKNKNYYKNYRYWFLQYKYFDFKLRKQFNYLAKKHNNEKIKIWKS